MCRFAKAAKGRVAAYRYDTTFLLRLLGDDRERLVEGTDLDVERPDSVPDLYGVTHSQFWRIVS